MLRVLCRRPELKRLRWFSDKPEMEPSTKTTRLPEWRKSWSERSGWYTSKLSVFQTGRKSRYMEMAGMGEGFVTNVQRSWTRARARVKRLDQEYLEERVGALGPDLAAAYFYCYRGGSVKVYNKDEWITLDKKSDTIPLPNKFNETYHIEKIDLENFLGGTLKYEGLKHIEKLTHLKWLSLKNNPFVDDWCMDCIVQAAFRSLEYLDITGCDISYRGLMALYKFENMKCIVVGKDQMVGEFEIACSMVEGENPSILFKIV